MTLFYSFLEQAFPDQGKTLYFKDAAAGAKAQDAAAGAKARARTKYFGQKVMP